MDSLTASEEAAACCEQRGWHPEPERRRPEPGGGSPTLRDTPPKHVRFEGVQGAGRALRNQRQARKAERRQEWRNVTPALADDARGTSRFQDEVTGNRY